MFNMSHDISTLNSPVATTIDSVDGYTGVAKDSESGGASLLSWLRPTRLRPLGKDVRLKAPRPAGPMNAA